MCTVVRRVNSGMRVSHSVTGLSPGLSAACSPSRPSAACACAAARAQPPEACAHSICERGSTSCAEREGVRTAAAARPSRPRARSDRCGTDRAVGITASLEDPHSKRSGRFRAPVRRSGRARCSGSCRGSGSGRAAAPPPPRAAPPAPLRKHPARQALNRKRGERGMRGDGPSGSLEDRARTRSPRSARLSSSFAR